LIVGGGIGGLSAALALRQVGFAPDVCEQAPALLEVGAAIAVWPNALRVLRRLGVGDQVLQRAGVIEQVQWRKRDGRLLKHVNFPRTDAPAVALHRADLQRALLDALPASSIHLGRVCASYQQTGDEIHARFADGTTQTCDLLIGADGLHSQLHAQVLADEPPRHRGYTVWRGVTNCAPQALPPNTALEFHGRGQRFGIGPVGKGRTGWWATANERADAVELPRERQRKLLTLFADWYEPVLELIAATPAETILHTAAYDRPPARTWGTGRMTLLGDAVHPMTPNLGQGGCMAIEDAAVLARCLLKYGVATQTLRTYERLRQARTALITNYSRRYGRIGQWQNLVSTSLRSLSLALMPQAVLQRALRLIFDYDAYAVDI
jgi:2-polyprenyl-6-methoxyphenol hydroxylase-like FAD-dependent oxidoreductase